MDSRPIGIMDSGLGGIMAVRELSRLLPGERIVYIGDTKNLPYGVRRPDEILSLTRGCVDFLLGHDVKAVLIACGTAASASLPHIQRDCDLPVLGVIEPGASAAARATKSGRVGVIATTATIDSGVFDKALRALNPGLSVYSEAFPQLVTLVEEGRFSPDDEHARGVVEGCMKGVIAAEVDTLVLGCTHFTHLTHFFRELMPNAEIIDTCRELALSAAGLLRECGQLCDSGAGGADFYATGDVQSFARNASTLLRRDISRDVYPAAAER